MLENLRPYPSFKQRFPKQTTRLPGTASFKWTRETNKHDATEVFGRVATDDLEPVSLLMGAWPRALSYCEATNKPKNCRKAVILKLRRGEQRGSSRLF